MEALSLAANIISVVHVTSEVIDRLHDFKTTLDGLPRALQAISNELPTLRLTLKKVSEAIDDGRVTEDSQEALRPLIADFEEQIRGLADIVDKMRPKVEGRMARNFKAVKSFKYDGQIKYHESVIRGYAATLSLERVVSGPGKDLAALQPPLVPTFLCPYGRDPDFIERPLLADILAQRQPGTRHALVGGAGMGKSQLAISYGYNIQDAFPETWVFWINAESTTKLEQGYREIAHAVHVKGRNDKNADILNLVYEWLRNKSNGNWVMILDNADDKDVFTSRPSAHGQASSEKEVRDFLPQSSNGSILVTSRSRDAAFQVTCNYKHIFAVEPMTESEAMALLRIHLEETHPESEMKQLATTLGSVPLAISQAAANISRRSLPISDYLEELRKGYDRSAHLLEESTPQLRRDSGRSNSIVATWKVTFEYVRKTTPSAARLLSLMCCFDCQDVPQALLEDQYGQEINAASVKSRRVWWKRITRKEKKKGKLLPEKSFSHDFEEDLLTLRDFSMIKLNRDRNKFSMHPMVQFTTLRWLFLYQELDAWSQHYISIMNTHFAMPEIGRRKICEPLIGHAVAALPFRPIDKAIRPLQTWAELAFKVACYYDFPTGAVVSPEKLFCIAAAAFEVALGANSSQSIQCNIRRSSVLRFSGHLTDAEKLSRRVLRLRLDSLGPNHPDTIESMDDVADVLKAQKKRGEADEIYVQAINIRLRVLGPAHDDTQRALIFHARSFCNNDDYCGAYKVYRQAYEGRCQGRVGAFDAEWAHHLNNLGLELQVKGRLKEAEQLFREAIAEYGKIEPGWWLIENLVRLGRALAAQDDYVGAEPFYARAMVWYDMERVGEYPEKLPAMEEYAYCLWKLDRLEEAEDIASRCWEARVEKCGMQDRDTYSIMWILANILEKRGRDDEALPLFRMAFEGIRDILGEQHEDTTSFQRDYLNLLEKSNSNALEYSDTSTAERVMKSDEIVALAAIHTVDSDKQLSDSDGLVTVAEADKAVLLSEVILERNKASTAANSRLGSYGPERFICDDEKKEASISLNFNVMVERAGIPQLQQI